MSETVITILCVDDEPTLRSLLVEELVGAGFNTLEAGNGLEALDVIALERPDIIISDVGMPVMDGPTLLSEIQHRHPELADIPFIFLSAHADPEQLFGSLPAGAADYLVRPVDFGVLYAKLECLTESLRYRVLSRPPKMRASQAR